MQEWGLIVRLTIDRENKRKEYWKLEKTLNTFTHFTSTHKNTVFEKTFCALDSKISLKKYYIKKKYTAYVVLPVKGNK